MTDFDGGDVIVVGAGLIGLSIGFELASRGASVRIYDRSEPGRGASWAGAGMLAPYTESVANAALRKLCEASLHAYPQFVDRVVAAGGRDPRLRLDGLVHAAFDDQGLAELRRLATALDARGIAHETLDRTALLAGEPWLGQRVAGGLIVASEGSVDNRRLGRALAAACANRGVAVRGAGAVALECDARRVLGIRTELGFVSARTVVNACGAWAGELGGVPQACRVPVEPVKGQMLALAAPAGLVSRPTWVPGAYLVPRDDGRLLLGATVERSGFDERPTAWGTAELLRAALKAAPGLGGFTVTESWAGLRPGSPDGLPFLGPTPVDGFFVASGHYRNGILLAPATATGLADAIEGRPSPGLEPFGLARLRTEAANP